MFGRPCFFGGKGKQGTERTLGARGPSHGMEHSDVVARNRILDLLKTKLVS